MFENHEMGAMQLHNSLRCAASSCVRNQKYSVSRIEVDAYVTRNSRECATADAP